MRRPKQNRLQAAVEHLERLAKKPRPEFVSPEESSGSTSPSHGPSAPASPLMGQECQSEDVFETQLSTESITATRLSMHTLEEEQSVDNVLFHVQVLAERPLDASLVALVDYVALHPSAFASLSKTAAGAVVFFTSLEQAARTLQSSLQKSTLSQLAVSVAEATPRTALLHSPFIALMKACLAPPQCAPLPSSAPTQRHWARRVSAVQPELSDVALRTAVLKAFPDAALTDNECHGAALGALVDTLLKGNQEREDHMGPQADSPVLQVASLSLITRTCELILGNPGLALKGCQLLELVTCSDVVKTVDGDALQTLFGVALDTAVDTPDVVLRHGFLKVLVNIGNTTPSLWAAHVHSVGRLGKLLLCSMSSDGDSVALACCVLLTVLTKLPDHRAAVQDALKTSGDFAAHLVTYIGQMTDSHDTADNVAAGYGALLLLAFTLGDESLRLEVIRCIVAVPKLEAKAEVRRHPMRWPVAVVQEFIMFQSAAGVLTKTALEAMQRVTTEAVKENQIVMEAE